MRHFLAMLTISVVVLFSLGKVSYGQSTTLRVDEKLHVAVSANTDIDAALENGIRAFVFLQHENKEDITQKTAQLSRFSANKNESVFLLFPSRNNAEEFQQIFPKNGKEKRFFLSTNDISDTTKLQVGIRYLLAENICELNDSINVQEKYHGRFASNPAGKMVLYDSRKSEADSLQSVVLNNWFKTGRPINFLLIDLQTQSKGIALENYFNGLHRLRGEVKYNNERLDEIYWKQLPGSVTPGLFSFPITDYSVVVSPYKNGYRITPGEVIHHTHMIDVVRPFLGYNSNISDGLLYHFAFDDDIKNTVQPDFTGSISNSCSWEKNAQRGEVIRFEKNNSFVDYTQPNGLNFDTPISVSVWLKPEKLEDFVGVLGIGSSFSLKLQRGSPDFTTAQIKDHIAETKLAIQQWTHVGFVFNPGATIDFYINGKKNTTLKASSIKPSEQSLLIGNNIWGEQYLGCMDELMIWDRGLSAKEFEQLYAQQLHPQKSKSWLWLLALPLIVALVWLLRKKKKPEIQQKKKVQQKAPVILPEPQNSIEVFGRFNVSSATQGNITSQFSPLLKQLLAFFILKTWQNNNSGISSKELTDVFWPGFTKEQAKDNRGTNIKKLRKILGLLPGVQIVFRDKKWFLECDEQTQIDLLRYKTYEENGQTEAMLQLLQKGNMLQETEAAWIDAHKNLLTEQVIAHFGKWSDDETIPAETKAEAAKVVLLFDDVNEEALKLRIQFLNENGNHGLARQTYDEFARRYQQLYAESFPVDFNNFQKK